MMFQDDGAGRLPEAGDGFVGHDVFISHSTRDKLVADAVCGALETAQHACWIAPRDVLPGIRWSKAIMDAIDGARVMVLVYSRSSNDSEDVERELHAAARKGVAILPFRIEDVQASGTIEYFIGPEQWLDATDPPTDDHLKKLCESVGALLRKSGPLDGGDVAGVVATARAAVTPPVPAAPKPVQELAAPVPAPRSGCTWKLSLTLCVTMVSLLFVSVIGLQVRMGASSAPGTPGSVSAPPSSTSSPRNHGQKALDWVDRNCKASMGTLMPDMTKTIQETASRDRTFWTALGSDLTKDGRPYIVYAWNKGFSAHRLTDKQAKEMHLTPTGLLRATGEDTEAPRSTQGHARLSRLRINNANSLDLEAPITGSVHVSSLGPTSGTVALRLGYFTLGGTVCTFHVPDDAIKAGRTAKFSFKPVMEKGDEGPPVRRPFIVLVDLCDIIALPDDYCVLSDSLSQLVDGD